MTMKNKESYTEREDFTILDQLIECYPDEEFLIADGFDEAIIGLDESEMRIIYSVKKSISILGKNMDYDEAVEYFNFNTLQAYVGNKTPIWCQDDF